MLIRPIQPYVIQKNRKQILLESPTGAARIDTVSMEKSRIESSRDVVLKMTHFGRKIGINTMVIDDFVSSEVDIRTGEVLSIVSSVQSSGSAERFVGNLPDNFIGPDGLTKENYRLPLYPVEELERRTFGLHSNNYPILHAEIFEDQFNVPYNDTLGAVMGLLTSVAEMIPFQATVIMDTELGVNVRDIKKPTDGEWVAALVPQFKTFLTSMNSIYRLYAHTAKKYEQKLRLHAKLHPFGVSFDVFDKTLKHHFHGHLNNSDHCRILKTLQAVDAGYLHGETLWNLNKTKFPSIMSSIFLDEDECESFRKGSVLQPYETLYPWR